MSERQRIPVLYLCPWVDYGGSDKNTIDWFRWLDRDRFAPHLITTQPSPNRLLKEIAPYAEEIWVLPDLIPAEQMPAFIFDFIRSRGIRVVQLMNSRLGFDLLPDLASLPAPPATVVQMHAEEADRSGYVQYVAKRHGHLVDAFSMSNRPVADAVEEYGVAAEKVHVIYTGVDPDEEFSPERAEPVAELPADRLQILFAARLVAQKDPMLMLDVAAALRERGASFQIQVVGDGDMEDEIRERIAAEGLGEHVLLNPPMPGLQPWYAACDVLLMTSTFEGIPVVLFEAMAMGLPLVAPALPAIGELLNEPGDYLISPRDSVEAYVEALARLAGDREHLAEQSARMRERARAQFTVQQMADQHGDLYEALLAGRATGATDAPAPATEPGPALAVAGDPPAGDPALAEKLLRHFLAGGKELDAIVLVDGGANGHFSLRALGRDEGPDAAPHTVIWRRSCENELPGGAPGAGEPAPSLARRLSGAGLRVERRHAPAGNGEGLDDLRARLAAGVPRGGYSVPRWGELPTWVPTKTRILPGVGGLRTEAFDGTAQLIQTEGEYRVLPREETAPAGAEPLGYFELAGFPQMDTLAIAVDRESGDHVLVTLAEDDPRRDEVDVIDVVGYVEPVPARPRRTPAAEPRPDGLVGLVRTLDEAGRRHRYAIGELPAGELVCELGALAAPDLGGDVAAWIVDGRLVTERHRAPQPRPLAPLAAARWVAEPAAWRGLAPPLARGKVAARRAATAAGRLRTPGSPPEEPSGEPAGWLFASPRAGRAPLFVAYHPVTGDQLLTRAAEDAASLGYGPAMPLGYVRLIAPLSGALELRRPSIPWARRFGAVQLAG